jgi:integrase/recombinase XerD
MTTRISKKGASVDAILRTGHVNNKGQHPVKIRVTYNRKSRYYPVKAEDKPLYMMANDWEKLNKAERLKGEQKANKETIETLATRARDARDKITQNNQQFSFERFEKEFLLQESKRGFLKVFSDHLQVLLNEERIGTYEAYKNAYTAFNKFRGAIYKRKGREAVEVKKGKELSPIDLNTKMLNEFETKLKKNGAGRTTIGMYMRSLKVIYNLCLEDNPSLKESYPFALKATTKKGYKISTGGGKKGFALTVQELRAFMDIPTEPGAPEHEAKLLWLFSFHCDGMNFRDIALLKHNKIDWKQRNFTYVREKTKRTEEKEVIITVTITDEIEEIIKALSDPFDNRPQSYVFNFGLTNGMDPKQEYATIKQKLKINNEYTKRLCRDNDLCPITTYCARHTWATITYLHELASIEYISERLDHNNLQTTKTYLEKHGPDKTLKVSSGMRNLLNPKAA